MLTEEQARDLPQISKPDKRFKPSGITPPWSVRPSGRPGSWRRCERGWTSCCPSHWKPFTNANAASAPRSPSGWPTCWAGSGDPVNGSREIDWYRVWTFVRPFLRACPYPGTPRWCELSDHDPAKLAAFLLTGALWSLNESARQDGMRQASRAVPTAADWHGVARRIDRGRAYIPRDRTDR